jgi:hypothetical protein
LAARAEAQKGTFLGVVMDEVSPLVRGMTGSSIRELGERLVLFFEGKNLVPAGGRLELRNVVMEALTALYSPVALISTRLVSQLIKVAYSLAVSLFDDSPARTPVANTTLNAQGALSGVTMGAGTPAPLTASGAALLRSVGGRCADEQRRS